MRFLERHDDDPPPSSNPGDASSSLLNSMRQEGNRLLAAGDEAINRALAGANSEAILRASRQQGGE